MFEVRWIHPLMSVTNVRYLVVAAFSSEAVAQNFIDDMRRFYADCYFEIRKV